MQSVYMRTIHHCTIDSFLIILNYVVNYTTYSSPLVLKHCIQNRYISLWERLSETPQLTFTASCIDLLYSIDSIV